MRQRCCSLASESSADLHAHGEGNEARAFRAGHPEVPLPELDQMRVPAAEHGRQLSPAALDGGHRQLALEQVIDLLSPVVEMQADGRAGLEPRVDGQLESRGEELLFEARLLREDPLGEILAAAAPVAALCRI